MTQLLFLVIHFLRKETEVEKVFCFVLAFDYHLYKPGNIFCSRLNIASKLELCICCLKQKPCRCFFPTLYVMLKHSLASFKTQSVCLHVGVST